MIQQVYNMYYQLRFRCPFMNPSKIILEHRTLRSYVSLILNWVDHYLTYIFSYSKLIFSLPTTSTKYTSIKRIKNIFVLVFMVDVKVRYNSILHKIQPQKLIFFFFFSFSCKSHTKLNLHL
jgi:hypothetical protein